MNQNLQVPMLDFLKYNRTHGTRILYHSFNYNDPYLNICTGLILIVITNQGKS